MTKFKVGDIVTGALEFQVMSGGRTGKITRVGWDKDRCKTAYNVEAYGDNPGNLDGTENWFDEELVLVSRGTVEGSRYIARNGKEVEVVSVNNNYVVTADVYDGSRDLSAYTQETFDSIFTKVEDEVELTIAQIAEKFDISVEQVRIKE